MNAPRTPNSFRTDGRIDNRALDKTDASEERLEPGARSRGQVIHNADIVSRIDEMCDNVGADEKRPANNLSADCLAH